MLEEERGDFQLAKGEEEHCNTTFFTGHMLELSEIRIYNYGDHKYLNTIRKGVLGMPCLPYP